MKIRTAVNALSLAVVFAGTPLALKAQADRELVSTEPAPGGTCCDRAGSTCYLNLGGVIIQQTSAYAC